MGVILCNYQPKSSHIMDPFRCMFDFLCVSTHFETMSGCNRGKEFLVVRLKKTPNNLKDLITRCWGYLVKSQIGYSYPYPTWDLCGRPGRPAGWPARPKLLPKLLTVYISKSPVRQGRTFVDLFASCFVFPASTRRFLERFEWCGIEPACSC